MITEKDKHIIFNARITPYSRENKIDFRDGEVSIKIRSVPAEGRANKALIEFLSILLSIPRRNISIRQGFASRNKVIELEGITKDEFLEIINK